MRIYNLGVALLPREQADYDYWAGVYESCYARFERDAALAGSCIASKDNRLAYALAMGWNAELPGAKQDRWSPQTLGKAANMWLRASKRCELIVRYAHCKHVLVCKLCNSSTAQVLVLMDHAGPGNDLQARLPAVTALYHGMIASQQRVITTTKHFKTKPDVTTTKTKTVGAATLRREAVEAFNDSANAVRVLAVAAPLEYPAHAGLVIETAAGAALRFLPGACADYEETVLVHVYCKATFEHHALLRRQRGLQVQEISSIQQVIITL